MAKLTIDDVDVSGKRVLMRVDFNVPLSEDGIRDDRRIRAALPSIRSVCDRGGRLILASHLGRPSGEGPQSKLSLQPCAARLAQLTAATVSFAADCVGPAARSTAACLQDGEILLLENLRFHAEEKKGDREFARRLSALADIYCNDAFGTSHRDDASVVALPEAMADRPRVAGLLLEKEIRNLGAVLKDPARPFVAILGGAKVSDKIGVIGHLLSIVDRIIIGGAMAYTFLKTQGRRIGDSPFEESFVDEARKMLAAGQGKLRLPADIHCASTFSADSPRQITDGDIPDGWLGLDIGPRSIERFTDAVASAATIVWNGPMGVFEMPPFDAGTRAVAKAMQQATVKAGAVTVVGGGDSAAAIEQFGLAGEVTHVSTGGGASLSLLEGKSFRSVELLDEGEPAARTNVGEPLAVVARPTAGFTTRPIVAGRRGVVCAGHYLAAAAGLQMVQLGGNAIDAGVAMGFCSAVLEPHLTGVGGESPILIHHASTGRVVAVNGQGVAPKTATIDRFRSKGMDLIPGDGLLAATVPSQVDNWITALAQFGTMNLETVLSPAIDLARRGFAMYHGLSAGIANNAERFGVEWPSSAAVYLPGGRVPRWGDIFRNPQWADTFEMLIRSEQEHASLGRVVALERARDVFYRGPIAERIAAFCRDTQVTDATGQKHAGLLSYEDLAEYHAVVEATMHVDYHGLEVHKCGPWSQGPVFLQLLRLLDGFDLASMGHNSARYIHTWIECAKLAFADRERYYGDPAHVDVPMDHLLSTGYAEDRRALIDRNKALLDPPEPLASRSDSCAVQPRHGDTTHLCAIDGEGNMIAATSSGGWIQSSPVIPGLGFPLGTRAQMFSLDPDHPNALVPGKRPRTTLTPSLVMKDGRPHMVFGTPGGDNQDQWTLQFFLNVLHFGMNLQKALDAPSFHSEHFPSSFYPREAEPGRLVVERPIGTAVRRALSRRGHEIVVVPEWSNGRVLAAQYDADRGVVCGGASPRGETGYAIAW